MLNKSYSFYTEGNLEEAVVNITYTDEELLASGIEETDLKLYYYNYETLKYEEVECSVDIENNTLTAKLKHFSTYVLGYIPDIYIPTKILLVLDNSWSMYSNEQYQEITGNPIDTIGLGADPEKFRFKYSKELIDKLSIRKYEIGLSEFRYDYGNISKIGSSNENLKKSIDNMDGNFHTNTPGTNIVDALYKAMDEFNTRLGFNYIVILTDGQDAKLKKEASSIIEDAIEKRISICSIGFGEGVGNVDLANISNATGCKFYSSTSTLGLEELFYHVEIELKQDVVDLNDDGKNDGILIADSGFIVNRDGFSFNNYGSNLSEGGHCYGMATIAQLYYKKVLPLSFASKTVEEKTSHAYDLTNTYFKEYANLYDYKLKTNALKYEFGYDIFGEEMPSDLMYIDGKKMIYLDKYKTEIENSYLYDFIEIESGLSKKEQLEKWGGNYKKVESVLFNEDKMQKSTIISNDEKQILNAIYAGFIRQRAIIHYSSGSNLILWLRDKIGVEPVEYTGKQGFINVLKARLDDKDAPVIVSKYSGGVHAVNAISLVRDIDNPKYYYIGVYDNNYPGQKRYVDLKCNKDTCVTVANSYYSNFDEPIRMTPSLEYDLKYFNNWIGKIMKFG